MFDIGWSELLIIGIVALIVVGPKDLPGMFRILGRFTGKMRGMAREFQRAMNQAADESGVKDISKEIRAAASPKKFGLDTVRSAAKEFQDGLVTGEKSASSPVSGSSKAGARSTEKKSAGDTAEEHDDVAKPTSAAGDSPAAASEPKKANGKQNAPAEAVSSDAAKTSDEPNSAGKPSSSLSSADAKDSESDEEARRAESDL